MTREWVYSRSNSYATAMSLKEQIQEDMRSAARAKESGRLSTLRLLISALRQQEIDKQAEIDDAGVVAIIGKMIKQREESAALYEKGERTDLAEKERAENAILEKYLPELLADEELDRILSECVESVGAKSPKDMGRVMALVKERVAGRADMSAVSAKVKKILQI